MAPSSAIPARLRSDGVNSLHQADRSANPLHTESWVEIASQPSTSSLSSINDEIVTTGLRVQQDSNVRRRRRALPGRPSSISCETRQTSTSSQEEYEESESDEDRVMTSSNEHMLPTTSHREFEPDSVSDSDEDGDENATALGRRTAAGPFTPQPNAFSHPPSSAGPRPGGQVPGSYFPHYAHARQSYPPRISRQHSYHSPPVDHDAALRASLNTLLSIGAAAARGLPKRNQVTSPRASNEPIGLRFVPESELPGPPLPGAAANTSRPLSPSMRARSSPAISSPEPIEKGKRRAALAKPSGEKSRALKKKKLQALEEESLISPTMPTWVMSAGVLVLVSVVGFGAGYVIGREVGRGEVMTGLNGSSLGGGSGNCGQEVVKSTGSLRRLKWGIEGATRGVVA